ncbi:MAG: PEP-utilizing enzyme [Actinomycetota bacterium]
MGTDQARAVASLAERLENERGGPQDVEWAIADGELHLLQSRPITALPVPPDIEVPGPGTWLKDTAHYPELMTPFGASTFLPALDAGITHAAAEYGLLIETMTNVSLGGEVYGQPTPVGGKSGPPPPAPVMGVLARIVPPLRSRMRAAKRVVRGGLLDEVPRRWETEWRDEFREENERFRQIDLAELGDAALQAHLDGLVELLHHGQVVHFRLFLPYAVAVHELVTTCEELLGWTTLEALDLVTGLSDSSSEPARDLAELAARIRGHPKMAGHDHLPPNLLEWLRDRAPDLATAVDDHVDRYGHRSPNYDPGARTMAERPQLVATLLREAIAAERRDLQGVLTARREAALQRARQALGDHREQDRRRFEQVLARAESVYGVREDNVFWTDNLPSGLLRRALLEVGNRLAARGQLHRPGDAAYLEIDEVRAGLRDRDRDLTATATRRRAEEAWVAAHPGPAFHGDEPAPMPDTRFLPSAGRRINAAMMWFMGHELAPTAVHAEAGLGGVPGSPGRYTGIVRVIRTEAEFHRLRPGDVLVAPVTSPPWSVLFGLAGAVVTDGGGTLSHAAIVAREHGIPAVLNTTEATTRLVDGQAVTVDGTAGVVHVDRPTIMATAG